MRAAVPCSEVSAGTRSHVLAFALVPALLVAACGDDAGSRSGASGDAGAPRDAFVAPLPRDAGLALPSPDEMFRARAVDLVRQMTLEEKIAQLQTSAPAIARLGLPAYDYWNEALHGVAQSGLATVFPQPIGLAATFDEELVERIGVAISDEGRAKFHDTLRRTGGSGTFEGLTFFAPNVNLLRDPRWGREHETYGEDPVLTATLGGAYVRGMQGDDPIFLKTVSTAKHFAVHSGPEATRHSFNAVVSARDLGESYLPQFEELVRDVGVYSVMAAYNRVNGEACTASPTLLQHTLRERWRFGGYVVGDCYALEDLFHDHGLARTASEAVALALHAGTDLDCGSTYATALGTAIAEGRVTEADIDRALVRVLLSRFRLGLFEPPGAVAYASIPLEVVDSAEHRALALAASRESLVLLRNDGVLPLDPARAWHLAVVGPTASDEDVLVGSYHGTPSRVTTIVDGIRAVAGAGATVDYVPGTDIVGTDTRGIARAVAASESADVVIAVVGLSPIYENEPETAGPQAGDRTTLALPGAQQALLEAVVAVGKPVIVVLTGGPFGVTWASDHAAAIIAAFYPGQDGGAAVAELIFGRFSPSGHLPVTYYARAEDLPAFDDYRMQGRTYRFFAGAPLYPFGLGLSYTSFRLSSLRVAAEVAVGDSVGIDVDVTNTGARTGAAVVQVYLRHGSATAPTDPLRSLAAFARAELAAGETRTLHLTLSARRLAIVDDLGRRIVEPGSISIAVGLGQPRDDGTYASDVEGLSTTLLLTGERGELL